MGGGNPGGFASDPFAGCATTRVAGEMEGGQRSAADLWEGAHRLVGERLTELGVEKRASPGYSTSGAASCCAASRRFARTRGRRGGGLSDSVHAEGACAASEPSGDGEAPGGGDGRPDPVLGCSREFGHVEYPDLGHRAPKGEGGSNGLDDRALRCGPCNRRESNTLTGLRKRDRKGGFMAKSQRGKGSGRGQRRRLLGPPPRTGGEGNGRHRPATPPQGQ